MIMGIGIDILEISRVEEKLANRILSKEEFEIWDNRRDINFLAGRFALKEAFLKAIGIGIRVDLRELSFVPDDLGAIHLLENERVKILEDEYGFNRSYLSISHDAELVVAVAIIEKV